MPVLCLNEWTYRRILTIWYGYHSCLFAPHRHYKILTETALAGTLNRPVWKDYAIIAFLVSETVPDRPMVTMDHSEEVIGCRLIRVGSSDLEWLWTAGREASNFSGDLRNYGLTQNDRIWHSNTDVEKNVSRGQPRPRIKTAGPQRPQFFDPQRRWNLVCGVACSRVSATAHRKGCGPTVPQIFRPFYMRARSRPMRNSKQVFHGDQTRCEAIFTRSTTNADARSVCGS